MYYMLKTLGEGGMVDNTRINQPVRKLHLFFVLRGTKNCCLFYILTENEKLPQEGHGHESISYFISPSPV